ncbi:Ger(x)C family spore germination protein [Bacillus chungangensis]|uniref:Ger(X)C family germination protein n=1 Tax=Bacillus chungangensis TaxID=587633 RepID=A0ABT9WVZ0_9BACI|nr:Ger(x)C family spore germination protein [Bacillus chungangensis]MDQ0177474.1 Ger(x)C family germination protein [Bacillus chungangensis]
MKKITAFFICISCLLFLTGCHGHRSIQDLTYIVAIGIDYDLDKKEYIVYTQSIDFMNVAKQEGGRQTEPIPNWIGIGRGKTIYLALSNLFPKSQPPLFLGHLKAIIFSETILKHKFKEIISDLGRNETFRYTVNMFATDESLEKILSQNVLFHYPPLHNYLSRNTIGSGDTDFIQLMTGKMIVSNYYKPIGSVMIPSFGISEHTWKSDGTYPVIYTKGAYFFQQKKYKGFLKMDQLKGFIWKSQRPFKQTLPIYRDGDLIAVISVFNPTMDIKVREQSLFPTFDIHANVQASLVEKRENISFSELHEETSKSLKKVIFDTYEHGFKRKLDIFNLGDRWYRFHRHHFKAFSKSNPSAFYLKKNALKNIELEVEFTNFNSFKYNHHQQNYHD